MRSSNQDRSRRKELEHRRRLYRWLLSLYVRRWRGSSSRVSRAELVGALQTERDGLESTIHALDEAQTIVPGVQGEWSLKDLMAHVATWDVRGTEWIRVAVRNRMPYLPAKGHTWEDMDRLNQQTFLEYHDASLSDVLAEFRQSYERLLEQVQSLTERQVGKPLVTQLITWRCQHYHGHAAQVRAWLDRLAQNGG